MDSIQKRPEDAATKGRGLVQQFSSYAAYHRTAGNKWTHYFGIPMILFSVFGLLAKAGGSDVWNLGVIFWAWSLVYYARLDWKRGLPFSVVTFGMFWTSRWVDWQVHVALFVFGWILQGIGHYVYEKRSPAFLTNFMHLMIGPFWIFCELISVSRSRRE